MSRNERAEEHAEKCFYCRHEGDQTLEVERGKWRLYKCAECGMKWPKKVRS